MSVPVTVRAVRADGVDVLVLVVFVMFVFVFMLNGLMYVLVDMAVT